MKKSVLRIVVLTYAMILLTFLAEPLQAKTKEKAVCNKGDALWEYNSLGKMDKDGDGVLSTTEAMKVRKLQITKAGELKKLPCFPNLKSLEIRSLNRNKRYTLDLSGNKKLTKLYCLQGLSKLDLSQNSNLSVLSLSDCEFETFDLSHNTKLSQLSMANCMIEKWDLHKQTELTTLNLSYCDFSTRIDLSNNQKLKSLAINCSSEVAQKLDLRKHKKLTKLVCTNFNLSELKLYKNNRIKTLDCSNNYLRKLDLGNNKVLRQLDCRNNKLVELNVSKCVKLKSIICAENQLTKLDTTGNTALTELICEENRLLDLNVKNNTKLVYLLANHNQLKKLNLSKNTRLQDLQCEQNRLTNLDLDQNSNLLSLRCVGNKLKNLRLSANKRLSLLICDVVTDVTGYDGGIYYSEEEYEIVMASYRN